MRKFLFAALSVAVVSITDAASADPVRAGFGVDVGVPSGAAVGAVITPATDAVRARISLTYDYLALGGRLSLQLDPMALIQVQHEAYINGRHVYWSGHDFPFGIFADIQGGFQPLAAIPGHDDLPHVGFDYVNLYGGLRFGNPHGFQWDIEAGPTYIHAMTRNFQSVVSNAGVNGLVLGNPTVNGWVSPTVITGFQLVFP